jgi:hypothetical protein
MKLHAVGVCFIAVASVVSAVFGLAVPAAADCGTTTPSGQDFVNNQVFLLPYSAGFDPKMTGKSYKSPSCNNHITSPYTTELINAFNVAPSSFQQKLCGLTCVFISECQVSNNCTMDDLTTGTWGFRERPDQSPGSGRYIATSAGLWGLSSPPTAPPALHDYEKLLLDALLSWPSGHNPPAYSQATSDDKPEMTVLAALAHEFGHVLWYDTFRPSRGGPYDFNTFCRGSFFTNSWQNVNTPPTWRYFGEVQDAHKIYDVVLADLALAISRNKFAKAASLLDKIYQPHSHWPSLFGAFSPDEDFVETFKFYVLTNASLPLTSLQINIYDDSSSNMTIPTYTENIPHDFDVNRNKKGELRRKVNCIGTLF